MNMHELPMILFTVLAQMSVGAFVVLGVVNLSARIGRRYGTQEIDELSDPAVLAVGATLVLGLGASMFHMNDVFNVLNVFRHLQTSWLSREIVAGMAFAGSGFLYAALQVFRIGSPRLREVLAFVTAILGVVLVVCMSMVYMSLVTVPAWNTWLTLARFATTALLLGSFALGTAFVTVAMLRRRGAFEGRLATRIDDRVADRVGWRLRDRFGGRDLSPGSRRLLLSCLRGIAVAGIVLLALQLVWYVLTVTHLAGLGSIGEHSLHAYTGPLGVVRFVLSVLGAGLLGLFLFRLAAVEPAGPADQEGPGATAAGHPGGSARGWGQAERIAAVVTVAFALILVSEFLARSSFYESMQRIGM